MCPASLKMVGRRWLNESETASFFDLQFLLGNSERRFQERRKIQRDEREWNVLKTFPWSAIKDSGLVARSSECFIAYLSEKWGFWKAGLEKKIFSLSWLISFPYIVWIGMILNLMINFPHILIPFYRILWVYSFEWISSQLPSDSKLVKMHIFSLFPMC